jgi:hypothetical protein
MLSCTVRRLSARGDDLYIQLCRHELATLQLAERMAVELDLGGKSVVRGLVRTKGSVCWLGPTKATSNRAITTTLRGLGLGHGSEVRAAVTLTTAHVGELSS